MAGKKLDNLKREMRESIKFLNSLYQRIESDIKKTNNKETYGSLLKLRKDIDQDLKKYKIVLQQTVIITFAEKKLGEINASLQKYTQAYNVLMQNSMAQPGKLSAEDETTVLDELDKLEETVVSEEKQQHLEDKPNLVDPEDVLENFQEKISEFNEKTENIKNKLLANKSENLDKDISDTLQELEDISNEANGYLGKNKSSLADYYVNLCKGIEGKLTFLKGRLQLYQKDLPTHKTAGFERTIDARRYRYVQPAINHAGDVMSSFVDVASDKFLDAKKGIEVQIRGLEDLYAEIEKNYEDEKYSDADRLFVQEMFLAPIRKDQEILTEKQKSLETMEQSAAEISKTKVEQQAPTLTSPEEKIGDDVLQMQKIPEIEDVEEDSYDENDKPDEQAHVVGFDYDELSAKLAVGEGSGVSPSQDHTEQSAEPFEPTIETLEKQLGDDEDDTAATEEEEQTSQPQETVEVVTEEQPELEQQPSGIFNDYVRRPFWDSLNYLGNLVGRVITLEELEKPVEKADIGVGTESGPPIVEEPQEDIDDTHVQDPSFSFRSELSSLCDYVEDLAKKADTIIDDKGNTAKDLLKIVNDESLTVSYEEREELITTEAKEKLNALRDRIQALDFDKDVKKRLTDECDKYLTQIDSAYTNLKETAKALEQSQLQQQQKPDLTISAVVSSGQNVPTTTQALPFFSFSLPADRFESDKLAVLPSDIDLTFEEIDDPKILNDLEAGKDVVRVSKTTGLQYHLKKENDRINAAVSKEGNENKLSSMTHDEQQKILNYAFIEATLDVLYNSDGPLTFYGENAEAVVLGHKIAELFVKNGYGGLDKGRAIGTLDEKFSSNTEANKKADAVINDFKKDLGKGMEPKLNVKVPGPQGGEIKDFTKENIKALMEKIREDRAPAPKNQLNM